MKSKQKSELLTRVSTSIIFGGICIFLITFSDYSRILFLGLVCVLSAQEYLKITGRDMWISILVPLSLFLLTCSYFSRVSYNYEYIYLMASIIYSVIAFVALFKKDLLQVHNKANLLIVAISIIFPMSLASSYILKNSHADPYLLLYILLLIWASDTFAYLVGRKLGKTKLIPSVSPNKTIEGSVGGGVFTILISLILAYFTGLDFINFALLGLLVWVCGSIGDLVQSSIKRHFSVKDSGSFLPGHGGFWDRFDSLIYTIPFVLLLQSLI